MLRTISLSQKFTVRISVFMALKSPTAKPSLKPGSPFTQKRFMSAGCLGNTTCSLHVLSTFSITENKQYDLKLQFSTWIFHK